MTTKRKTARVKIHRFNDADNCVVARQKQDDEMPDCSPVITAIGKGDKWEGSCACGWWTRGTKYECETRARSGHRMKPDETIR